MTPLAWKDTLTIYNYYKNDKGEETYFRTVLYNCKYSEDSIAVSDRTGNQVVGSATIHIPHIYNKGYTKHTVYQSLKPSQLGALWTMCQGTDRQTTMIVVGDCPFEFEFATGRDWLNQIEAFNEQYADHKNVKIVDNKNFGSLARQHLKVRC